MFKTHKARFIFFTVIFILLSVGIPTFFLIRQFENNFKQRSEIMLKTTLAVLRSGLYHSMLDGVNKNIQQIVDKVSLNEGVDHVRIFSEKGIILYSSDQRESGKQITDVAPHHVEIEKINQGKINLITEKNIYSASEPIENDPSCQNCHGTEKKILAYLDVDTDLTTAERYFFTGSFHIIFLAFVVIIVLISGSYFLFNWFINRPLRRFLHAFDEIEKRNFSLRLPGATSDEIGILERKFNHMASQLKSSLEEIEELNFEQLRRADKLVTLGELAAEMAHEINNPAAIILSHADFLRMEMRKKPELHPYNEDLEVIIRQVEKVSSITGSILKYGKKLPKNFTMIDLTNIANDCLKIIEPRMKGKNIQLTKRFEISDAIIFGDALQIEQALTNLVNNAVDALDKSGLLEIRIFRHSDGMLGVSVKDSGCGIDEHYREKLFSPFFTTKQADKGTGLGLYIVKNICKNHSANISFTSQQNMGTTFTILFNSHEAVNEKNISG